MPYLPSELPKPVPTLDTREWWEACKRHELVFQRCTECATLRHPPGPVCGQCHSFAYDWQRSAGRGKVFSFSIVHYALVPALQDRVPYNVSVIELDDAPSVRLISNVVDVAARKLDVGLAVEVIWEEVGELTLPRFRRASSAAGG
jgi:uncharacterized OB-fold protein